MSKVLYVLSCTLAFRYKDDLATEFLQSVLLLQYTLNFKVLIAMHY